MSVAEKKHESPRLISADRVKPHTLPSRSWVCPLLATTPLITSVFQCEMLDLILSKLPPSTSPHVESGCLLTGKDGREECSCTVCTAEWTKSSGWGHVPPNPTQPNLHTLPLTWVGFEFSVPVFIPGLSSDLLCPPPPPRSVITSCTLICNSLSTYDVSTNTSWSKGLLLSRVSSLWNLENLAVCTNGYFKCSRHKTDTCDQLAIPACPSISGLGEEVGLARSIVSGG